MHYPMNSTFIVVGDPSEDMVFVELVRCSVEGFSSMVLEKPSIDAAWTSFSVHPQPSIWGSHEWALSRLYKVSLTFVGFPIARLHFLMARVKPVVEVLFVSGRSIVVVLVCDFSAVSDVIASGVMA